MAITVEDGTGLGLANSYATAEEFVAYATDRGLTTISEADTDQQEIALIKAADYLQQKFRLLWNGARSTTTQRLDWPRRGVAVPDFFDPFFRESGNVPLSFQDTLFIAENDIPEFLKEAQYLVAVETFSGSSSTGRTHDEAREAWCTGSRVLRSGSRLKPSDDEVLERRADG
jgi:hypothetical protein